MNNTLITTPEALIEYYKKKADAVATSNWWYEDFRKSLDVLKERLKTPQDVGKLILDIDNGNIDQRLSRYFAPALCGLLILQGINFLPYVNTSRYMSLWFMYVSFANLGYKAELTGTFNILDEMFYGCSDLQEIYAPNVDWIGENALDGCSSLKKITLSSGIKETIEDYMDMFDVTFDEFFTYHHVGLSSEVYENLEIVYEG